MQSLSDNQLQSISILYVEIDVVQLCILESKVKDKSNLYVDLVQSCILKSKVKDKSNLHLIIDKRQRKAINLRPSALI